MRRLGILFILLFVAMIVPAAIAAELSIATVDLTYCMRNSTAAKRANDEMKVFEKERMDKLKAMQETQVKAEQDFVSKEKVLTDAAKKEKIEQFKKERARIESVGRTYSSEVQKKDAELSQAINKELQTYIEQISKEKKYNLILPTQAVIYSQGYPDISDEVVKRYNKAYEGKK